MTNSSSARVVAELRRWTAQAAPGARLPSTRELTARLGVGPGTVQQALATLRAEGVVETRPGAGTFARPPRAALPRDHGWQTAALGPADRTPGALPTSLRPAPPEAVALHSGYPAASLLPQRLVRTALARAARGPAALDRPPSAGLPELRSWFAAELADATPAGLAAPTAADVVVVPGTQSALGAVFRAVAGPARRLVVESPTYWGAILAAAQAGVELVPVPSGPHGPDLAALDRALAESGARGVYAQPAFANPTGALWADDHAEAVLRIVRARGAFLVEDDWAHDFAIEATPRPLAARDGDGHVVHLRSLTKSVSPSIRVGAVVARGPVHARIAADLQAQSLYVSGSLQAAALDVVTAPGWRTHLRGLRRDLAARRDLLVDAVRTHLPGAALDLVPRGGLNLWVRLDDGVDVAAVARRAAARGVLVAAGDEWFPAEATGPHLRLGFAGSDPGGFHAALAVVAEALASST